MDFDFSVIFWKILAVVVLVALNGFFVAAEFALVKIRDTQLNTLVNQGETQYQINTQTLSNQGPAFLNFAAIELGSQSPVSDCAAVLLRNGQLVNQAADAQVIAGQCMWTPAEGAQIPGVVPTGPRSFVTYPSEAQGFVNAQSIRINRYADQLRKHFTQMDTQVASWTSQSNYLSQQL